MKAITDRLQRMRFDRKRMSQRAVAHRAGMSYQRYWEIENGYREPDADDLRKLAAALRCTQADIMGQPEGVAS